ncbi:DUF3060 domain-containing protein [Mycobacterium sp. 050134]|uniref:DUF3060 domain-containing protein n=1 Tax=Mycobacterium sp. 050134 TaxID=3096111 RepID=UPI002ED9217F
MKDDDPENRIRELERELADVTRGARTRAERTPTATPSYDFAVPAPRRVPAMRWYTLVVLAVMVLSIIAGLVAVIRAMIASNGPTSIPSGAPSHSGPTAVPPGGDLRLTGNNETKTVACNDGKLTIAGFNNKYVLSGHCAALMLSGYNNNVTLDGTDALESTGYGNAITDHACSNAAVKLMSYGIVFNATGHCTSVAIASYGDNVTVDSVDTVTVGGYNNTVTYRSGAPAVTDSGYDNAIHHG